jgi:hypothetical protein
MPRKCVRIGRLRSPHASGDKSVGFLLHRAFGIACRNSIFADRFDRDALVESRRANWIAENCIRATTAGCPSRLANTSRAAHVFKQKDIL